jgi:hypothetical protein
VTFLAFDPVRCAGPHWVLKATTTKGTGRPLRNDKMSDTDGDGIDDRIDA